MDLLSHFVIAQKWKVDTCHGLYSFWECSIYQISAKPQLDDNFEPHSHRRRSSKLLMLVPLITWRDNEILIPESLLHWASTCTAEVEGHPSGSQLQLIFIFRANLHHPERSTLSQLVEHSADNQEPGFACWYCLPRTPGQFTSFIVLCLYFPSHSLIAQALDQRLLVRHLARGGCDLSWDF